MLNLKSKTALTIPEGIHAMLNGSDAEWDILDGKLYVKFGVYKIVAVLSKLPVDAWWEAVRGAFIDLPDFVSVSGLKSSVSRLSNFGSNVYIRDGKIEVNSDHWEPIAIQGNGEMFDFKS